MKLLVVGAREVDAGKTTFATGLVHRLGAPAFKPRAGNDYWHDHDDNRRSIGDGRLYGKDARRLAAASPEDVSPEAVNPVHRLWLPRPGAATGILGREERAFVVDRVTPPGVTDSPSGESDRFVVNATVEFPPLVRDGLPVDDAVAVSSLEECNRVMADLHRPATAALAEAVRGRERAVVESYADIADPLPGLEPDAVAAVEPRRVSVYDGERYARACEVASGSAYEGRLEERVAHVVELLDPGARVALPPLAAEGRTDPEAVADAYEAAYDAVVNATE